ncbi:MAG: dicarboxylate/amino acid:cation symporter [Oscillospiraceae bacterium]|jgi:proton glutamate symport protein|nr:dicarboxylate/amino acid:cation symporter [Oscillospiraceae bacterium]
MIIKILKNPITLFVSIILGIFVGIFFKESSKSLSIISDIYVNFLQMCILPIVACIIAINFSKISKGKSKKIIKKWIILVFVSFLVAALISILSSIFLKKFLEPSPDTKLAFSEIDGDKTVNSKFTELKFYSNNEIDETDNFSLYTFLINTIPNNIFSALSNGDVVGAICFFSILGIMLSKVKTKVSSNLLEIFDVIYNSLNKFVTIILNFSPISIFCVLAVQFSDPNKVTLIKSLIKLIIVMHLIFFTMIVISFIIIQKKINLTIKEHLSAISHTFFISIATRSCMASIPTAIEDAKKKLKLDETISNFTLPIGITMFQSGGIISAILATTYTCMIYDVPLGFNVIFGTILGSILYAFSFIGAPSIVAASMLSGVLGPLGLPSDIISAAWVSVLSISDPFLTFQCIYTNIAIAASLSSKAKTT